MEDNLGFFLFDSGASISLVASSFLRSIGTAFTYSMETNATRVNGDPLNIVGNVQLRIRIGTVSVNHLFKVFPDCKHYWVELDREIRSIFN